MLCYAETHFVFTHALPWLSLHVHVCIYLLVFICFNLIYFVVFYFLHSLDMWEDMCMSTALEHTLALCPLPVHPQSVAK